MGTVSILIEKYRFECTLYVYIYIYIYTCGFPWWLRWQRICLQCKRPGFDLWVRKILWIKEQQPAPVFLPGEIHEQKSLAGYSPWGCKESDTTEELTHTHTHIYTHIHIKRETHVERHPNHQKSKY